MKVGDQDTEFLLDLIRSPNTSHEKALALLNSVCRTAYSEGTVAASRATGDLINKTLGAILGVKAPERTIQ